MSNVKHACSNILDLFSSFRYTTQKLLNEPFFVENTGIKVEFVPEAQLTADTEAPPISESPEGVTLRLVVNDSQKMKQKHKNDEALEFGFDMSKDNPLDVAKEMVSTPVANIKIHTFHILFSITYEGIVIASCLCSNNILQSIF